jgi:hypothetical protein
VLGGTIAYHHDGGCRVRYGVRHRWIYQLVLITDVP